MEWFEDFLKNREQRVVLGESVSSWESFLSGVPQGLVLGPLLFVIYINDLTDSVNNRLKLHADDSKILSAVNSWADALGVHEDIYSISECMKDWRMRMNANKCKVIHFTEKYLIMYLKLKLIK